MTMTVPIPPTAYGNHTGTAERFTAGGGGGSGGGTSGCSFFFFGGLTTGVTGLDPPAVGEAGGGAPKIGLSLNP